MQTRYAITHIGRFGIRQLTRRNIGPNHFDTAHAAGEYMAAMLDPRTNRPSLLAQVYGPQAAGTFRVDPVECFDHGDAAAFYIDPEADAIENDSERAALFQSRLSK